MRALLRNWHSRGSNRGTPYQAAEQGRQQHKRQPAIALQALPFKGNTQGVGGGAIPAILVPFSVAKRCVCVRKIGRIKKEEG